MFFKNLITNTTNMSTDLAALMLGKNIVYILLKFTLITPGLQNLAVCMSNVMV